MLILGVGLLAWSRPQDATRASYNTATCFDENRHRTELLHRAHHISMRVSMISVCLDEVFSSTSVHFRSCLYLQPFRQNTLYKWLMTCSYLPFIILFISSHIRISPWFRMATKMFSLSSCGGYFDSIVALLHKMLIRLVQWYCSTTWYSQWGRKSNTSGTGNFHFSHYCGSLCALSLAYSDFRD